MKKYNVICPVCGAVNRNLYLEETGGWMECESCCCAVDLRDPKKITVPVFKDRKVSGMLFDQLLTVQ